MSFSLRRKRWRKGKTGRCPKGHNWCDGGDYCTFGRHNVKLEALQDEINSYGDDDENLEDTAP